MTDYLVLNGFFLLLAAGGVALCRPKHDPPRLLLVLAGLLLLSALFDPIIVGLGIVHYHDDSLLGDRWFGAPIEDFAYPLAAAVLLPALWQRLRRHHV